jgi:hypothetical protein
MSLYFFVDIVFSFHVDIINVDLNNYTRKWDLLRLVSILPEATQKATQNKKIK